MTVTADDGILSPRARQVGRRGAEIHVSESRAEMLESAAVAVRVDTAKLGSAQRDLLVYLLAATIAEERRRPPADDAPAVARTVDTSETLDLLAERTRALRQAIPPELEAELGRIRRTIDAHAELTAPQSAELRSAVRDAVAAMARRDDGATTGAVRLTRVPWASSAASEALGHRRSPSAVSQALQHLERRGLVFRDASGGRTTAVQLTTAGRRVAGELQETP